MSPAQCRAARALLKLEQGDLSKMAKVARSTLIDFERDARKPRGASIDAIRTALEAAGVVFLDPNGGGEGVRLRETKPSA